VGGIKYYQLSKGEEMPDEFCAVRDVGGEPSEYVFYVPDAENAKLRELCKEMMAFVEDDDACERCGHDAECVEAADGELVLPYEGLCLMLDLFADRLRELGVEVDG
jgi:hypothetical protein